MAKIDLPKKAPWLDAIKKSKQLTIYFHDSLGRTGWDKVFKDAILEFNKLSSSHKLGVTFVQEKVQKNANVEAQAARGSFEFEFLPNIKKHTIIFDGSTVHGLCKPVLIGASDKAKVVQWNLAKAFIIVPAAPSDKSVSKSRTAGDGVRLVIAVHEMLHACGLIHDDEHSVDDVFCWPGLRMGDKPSEDRLTTLGETYTFKGKPGEPPRVGRRKTDMPPVFLKNQTADKIRKLWA